MGNDSEIAVSDRLIIDPAAGTATFISQGQPLLRRATAWIAYRAGGEKRRFELAGPGLSFNAGQDKARLSRANGDLRLDWHLRAAGNGVEVWLEATNVGRAPLRLEELGVLSADARRGGRLELGPSPQDWSFYQNGWQSWSPAFARQVGDGIYVDPGTESYRLRHLPHGRQRGLSSEWITVIATKEQAAGSRQCGLLLGFVTAADQLAEIRLDLNREEFSDLVAVCYADGVTIQPDEKLPSEHLLVATGEDPLALLEGWAERLGEAMGARIEGEIPTGWCSWYYFYGENTAADVLDNMAKMDEEALPLKYILVDDGYQAAIGDWLTCDRRKFTDMKALAQAIKRAGHRPGIWTAPFGVGAGSQVYAEHPDWVMRDEDGEPIRAWHHRSGDVYALDLSHPQVRGWLFETFRTLRDWGFELFKVDFLFAGALAGRRYDPQMTRAQALRAGLKAIREAIGEDTFLLGCGAPLGPCVGIVDGMRIGTDVAINWHPLWRNLSMVSTENALRNAIARYFMHRRLWLNDPDCLLVRTRHDESDLVLNEMRTMTTLIGLSGGSVLSGDNFPSIRRGRLKYLRQILPPYGRAAIPLDLFDNEMPQRLILPIERDWGRWWVVALINWGDHTTSTTVSLDDLGLPKGRYHAYNYWRRRYLGVVEKQVTIVRHQPHCTALLLLKPVSDRPELLTSTFHITQGGVEVRAVEWMGKRALAVEMEKEGKQFGELLFTIPQGFRVKEVRHDGRRRGVRWIAKGIAEIGFTLRGRARVEMEFEVAGR